MTEEKLTNESLSLANFYAVDILDSILKNSKPSELEIQKLECELESPCTTQIEKQYADFGKNALIMSSNIVECNALLIMLEQLGFQVAIATNQAQWLANHKKNFQIVIISDYFKEAGFNLLVSSFKQGAQAKKFSLIYLGNDFANDYSKIGFHARLKSPFLFSSLTSILSKFLNNHQL